MARGYSLLALFSAPGRTRTMRGDEMKTDDHPGRYEWPSENLGRTADGKTKQGVFNHAELQSSEVLPWGMHSKPVSLPI